jgi:outer membrane protein assembly factor BamB
MYFVAFLCISSCYLLVSSQSLAAWSTGVGDQVVYQNVSSGELLYSIDTGSGIGAGGFTAWAKLPVTTPPKAGSRLVGTGYTGADGNIYVSR